MPFLPTIYLIDNGSLRPEATMSLRALATELSRMTQLSVEPVSLLHSSKVPAADLGGIPADTVKSKLRRDLAAGCRHFVFLPLFLGPSRAITEYLPELIQGFEAEYGDLRSVIANPLAGENVEFPDERLAQALARLIQGALTGLEASEKRQVALIDHGTPYLPVNTLRNRVAEQLSELLGMPPASVVACSMERREGDAYAFNEPLLEHLDGDSQTQLILGMFFLLPGRHAGDGGDVDTICQQLIRQQRYKKIRRTDLLGREPEILGILQDRLNEALEQLSG